MNPFAIDEQDAQALREIVREQEIKTVLEFGPGESTKVFLEVGCRVDAYEHDRTRWREMQRDSAFYSVENLLLVDQSAMKIADFGIRPCYDLGFIDGPPSGMNRWARWNTALFAVERCFYIALHDTKRAKERAIVNMLLGMNCTMVKEYDTPRGITLLKV